MMVGGHNGRNAVVTATKTRTILCIETVQIMKLTVIPVIMGAFVKSWADLLLVDRQ